MPSASALNIGGKIGADFGSPWAESGRHCLKPKAADLAAGTSPTPPAATTSESRPRPDNPKAALKSSGSLSAGLAEARTTKAVAARQRELAIRDIHMLV